MEYYDFIFEYISSNGKNLDWLLKKYSLSKFLFVNEEGVIESNGSVDGNKIIDQLNKALRNPEQILRSKIKYQKNPGKFPWIQETTV